MIRQTPGCKDTLKNKPLTNYLSKISNWNHALYASGHKTGELQRLQPSFLAAKVTHILKKLGDQLELHVQVS